MELNKSLPLVSIVVPVYKVEKYLCECLDSIINQTYKNLEIILVDDGSPDNCGKICDKYAEQDSRIKVIHKKNGGLSAARNTGIDASTGEWIYFCDSDDTIEKKLIEESLNTVMTDNTDMCFFDYDRVNNEVHYEHKTMRTNECKFDNTNDIETLITYFSEWGISVAYIVKADIIRGRIKFNEKIKYIEDEVFKFHLYGHIHSFSYMHKVFYHYRIVSTSITENASRNIDYIDMIFNVYHEMVRAISKGVYPENSIIVPNSKLLCRFGSVVSIAFQNKFSLKCDFDIIEKFLKSNEYKTALKNYSNILLNPSGRVCTYFKEPNRFIVTLFYLCFKIKKYMLRNKR